MSNGVILLKRPYISPNIAVRGSECENNLWEVMAWESFPGVKFDLSPLLQGKMSLFHPYYWCYGFRI